MGGVWQVFSDLESVKYSLAEYRVSVYGLKRSEWDKLGRWYYVNRLASFNVRWMIQIPRLYSVYKVRCCVGMCGRVRACSGMCGHVRACAGRA